MDGDTALVGSRVMGRPVLAQEEGAALRAEGVESAFVGVGGIADPGPRRAVAAMLREAGFRLPPIVHVASGARIAGDTLVGADAHIGTGAIGGIPARPPSCETVPA